MFSRHQIHDDNSRIITAFGGSLLRSLPQKSDIECSAQLQNTKKCPFLTNLLQSPIRVIYSPELKIALSAELEAMFLQVAVPGG